MNAQLAPLVSLCNEQAIKAAGLIPNAPLTLITDGHPRRMTFMPKHFGSGDMMRIEARIFAYADMCLEGYTGGSWTFAETPSGAGFLIPPKGDVIVAVCPELGDAGNIGGGYQWKPSEISCYDGGPITRQSAGLALTILAVNHHLAHSPRDPDRLIVLWDRLMEYKGDLLESRVLYRILD